MIAKRWIAVRYCQERGKKYVVISSIMTKTKEEAKSITEWIRSNDKETLGYTTLKRVEYIQISINTDTLEVKKEEANGRTRRRPGRGPRSKGHGGVISRLG